MFKLMRRVSLVVLAAVLAAIVVSCVPAKPEEPKLKLALIPVLDTIPIFIAQQNGYFAEQGITVETIPVKSPQERDVLVTTGQVDGVLTDLQSVGLLNKDAPKLKAVYTSRRPFPNAPMFRILAGPQDGHQRARRPERCADRHQCEHGHGVSDRSDAGG